MNNMMKESMNVNVINKSNINQDTTKTFLRSGNHAEWIAFGLFVIIYIISAILHEPMYDEAQAWMIARDASWKELLFQIPHYEGHPPFWHLILAIFAKSGVPVDIGLRIPGAIFSILAVWLMIFKSPFPKPVKCLLPFTYYILFRFSIVVRPYCIMLLAFCLVAMAYKRRAERPFVFAAALMLLCMGSAYGMAFAAGICIVWLIELFTKIKENYARQLISMGILLVCNIGQLLLMMPKDDTNAVSAYPVSTILYGLVYMFVIGPADSMFLDAGMDARLQNYAQDVVSGSFVSYVNLMVGLLTVVILVIYARKYRKLMLLTVPYSLFAVFSATVYFWYHHIGLIHLFLIFVFWCALAEKDVGGVDKLDAFLSKSKLKDNALCKQIPRFSLVLCLGMSIAWSVFCVGTDWIKTTWYTRDLAYGIHEVGADEGSCALQWDIIGVGPFEQESDYTDASRYTHIASITQFFDCLIYFDENIFYNHNGGDPGISYNRQLLPDMEGQALIMEEIAKEGYPEYIIGYAFVLDALPIEEEMPNYYPVYRFEVYKPDKFIIDYNDRYIYAREDIYMERDVWPIKEQLTIH